MTSKTSWVGQLSSIHDILKRGRSSQQAAFLRCELWKLRLDRQVAFQEAGVGMS